MTSRDGVGAGEAPEDELQSHKRRLREEEPSQETREKKEKKEAWTHLSLALFGEKERRKTTQSEMSLGEFSELNFAHSSTCLSQIDTDTCVC